MANRVEIKFVKGPFEEYQINKKYFSQAANLLFFETEVTYPVKRNMSTSLASREKRINCARDSLKKNRSYSPMGNSCISMNDISDCHVKTSIF